MPLLKEKRAAPATLPTSRGRQQAVKAAVAGVGMPTRVRRDRVGAPMRRAAATAVVLVCMAAGARAGTVQSLASLQARAAQAVRAAAPADARVVATPGHLDPRLRLAACDGKLRATPPDLGRGSARVSVPVSCEGSEHWTVRVPVQVQMFRKVLVSRHALARGDVMGAGDVQLEERDVARLGYGYVADATQLVGRTLRRALAPDTVITPGMLAPREVVKRGQHVSLVATLSGISVRVNGVALGAGDRGDLVQVRSLSCQCVVQGKVQAPGIVEALP